MPDKTPTEEFKAEVRNAYENRAYIMRAVKDGKKTVESAFIELDKQWQRVGASLKMLREVGL